MRFLIVSLIYTYAFIVPLGDLLRFREGETAYGLSTFVLMVIAALSILESGKSIISAFQRSFVLKAVVVLIVWVLVASLLAFYPKMTFIRGLFLLIYLLLATIAFHYIRNEATVVQLLTALCIGGLLGSIMTIVDFAGLIDIPGVNEFIRSTKIGQERFIQASGPFYRRSAMATYYTIIIVAGILCPLIYRQVSPFKKGVFLSSAGTCFIALALTHNRGGILASILTIAIILFVNVPKPVHFIRKVLIIGLLAVAVYSTFTTWFPETLTVYQAEFTINKQYQSAPIFSESDTLRILLFKHAVKSIFSNPIGHGYSLIYNIPAHGINRIDPHNIITQVIWASGLFGIVWLSIFGCCALKQSWKILRSQQPTDTRNQIAVVLLASLLGFFLYGMAHTTINTGVIWIIFGALLAIKKAPNWSSPQ